MNRIVAAALVVTTLCSAKAFADGVSPSATRNDVSLQQTAGSVPLTIRVTEARRVYVRDEASANGLRYMCTTPCRVYVHPGNVDVTLIGWGAHEYHWDVPEHGGAVNLQARPMPAAMVAARAAQQREAQTVRTGLAFGLAHSVGAGFIANGITLADAVGGIDG